MIEARFEISGAVVLAIRGDLTDQDVDVVVNAANERLAHGGGVAAAIVRAGGRIVQDESDDWIAANGPVAPGTAAITSAGAMSASHVVHVVGPRYRQGADNEGALRRAVEAALDAARTVAAHSVAVPAISAGIFGYPRAEATRVIASAAAEWLRRHPGDLDEIRLVGYDEGTAADFAAATEAIAPDAAPG